VREIYKVLAVYELFEEIDEFEVKNKHYIIFIFKNLVSSRCVTVIFIDFLNTSAYNYYNEPTSHLQ
jgi:hypothetical protein